MKRYTKNKNSDKTQVREGVLKVASEAFIQHGIKEVRMDDIASRLSMSKRTLYELFVDKEQLLLEVVKVHREGTRAYLKNVYLNAENVLEVIIFFYEKIIHDFQVTNRNFFEDMKKYPKVMKFLEESRRENAESTLDFYQKGVEQGLFLKGLNYRIIQEALGVQMDTLMQSCSEYTLTEIFETLMFTHLRGISTEEGLKMVDAFWHQTKSRY